VDDHDAAVLFDDRHVLADLAQAAQRQDAHRGAHEVTAPSSARALIASRITLISASSRSTYGRRTCPPGSPRRFSAALFDAAAGAMARASNSGRSDSWISARFSGSSTMRRNSLPAMWLAVRIPPLPPRSSTRANTSSLPA